MTPAEFKTSHECLGVSTEFIARAVGVSVGRIWAYEHPDRTADVPEHAASVMLELLTDFEASAVRMVEEIVRAGEGFVPRHVDLSAFEELVPAMRGWGQLAQGHLIAEVQRRLQVPVEYVK